MLFGGEDEAADWVAGTATVASGYIDHGNVGIKMIGGSLSFTIARRGDG